MKAIYLVALRTISTSTVLAIAVTVTRSNYLIQWMN